jgi:hypothetical protein
MPEARQARLACWTTCRHGSRRAELRLSNDHAGAAALGFGSPVILVGAALADVLDDEELDAIVMHEYAHLARRDDWSRLLQAVIGAFAGLHPAVALAARRIDVEREAACDDWVVRHAMHTRRYAACLTELAALVRSGDRGESYAIVPGATGSRGSLYTRVRRLLDGDLDRSRRIRVAPFAAAALGAAGVLLLAIASDPLVAFAHAATAEELVASTVAVPVGPGARSGSTLEAPAVPTRARAALVPVDSISSRTARGRVKSRTPQPVAMTPAADNADGAGAPSPHEPTLMAHSFSQPPHPAPAVLTAAIAERPDESAAVQDTAWVRMAVAGTEVGTRAARGGKNIGQGAKKAGLSVAGFFTRAGKGVAGSF